MSWDDRQSTFRQLNDLVRRPVLEFASAGGGIGCVVAFGWPDGAFPFAREAHPVLGTSEIRRNSYDRRAAMDARFVEIDPDHRYMPILIAKDGAAQLPYIASRAHGATSPSYQIS